MIHYPPNSWLGILLRVQGTVWPNVWWKVLLVVLYSLGVRQVFTNNDQGLAEVRCNVFGIVLALFLVFRIRLAYDRFSHGQTAISEFFCELRAVMSTALLFKRGGQRCDAWRRAKGSSNIDREGPRGQIIPNDMEDEKVSEERANIIRWSIVLAISVRTHAHVAEGLHNGGVSRETKWFMDWNRSRIRGLTTPEEFEWIDKYMRSLVLPDTIWDDLPLDQDVFEDGPAHLRGISSCCRRRGSRSLEAGPVPGARLPVAVAYRLSEVLCPGQGSTNCERTSDVTPQMFNIYAASITKLMKGFDAVNELVSAQPRFPYPLLCRLLLTGYFLLRPFLDPGDQQPVGAIAWASAVVEMCCLSFVLMGIEAVATVLEDPFADDMTYLDIDDRIATAEHEAISFAEFCEDNACRERFVWLDLPKAVAQRSAVSADSYLALRAQASSGGKARPKARLPSERSEESASLLSIEQYSSESEK